jgi:hypothetical protein
MKYVHDIQHRARPISGVYSGRMDRLAMTPGRATPANLLDPVAWRQLEAEHHERVDAALAGHRARRARGESHPVEDFLFTYYSYRPSQLRRWHPGVGVSLRADDGAETTLDARAFLARRADAVRQVLALLRATAVRPANLGCFGLHEWAMVYRLPHDDVRHAGWPLRLDGPATDAVVESHRLRCSHFDAFRFFTPDAAPRNEVRPRPRRETQVQLDQPGCLHATMDLYKWAHKLAPATPSSLVMDCFELARDVRTLDMRASPYDLRALGYLPVPIETADGKAEYVAAQRVFAERAAPLRSALVEVCDRLLSTAACR